MVLAMKRCEAFAERVCIAKPKHFKGFLFVGISEVYFLGGRGYKGMKGLLPSFVMTPE